MARQKNNSRKTQRYCYSCLVILLICLAACEANRLRQKRLPVKLIEIARLPIAREVKRIVYQPRTKTFFLLDTQKATVQVYRHGEKINQIGGFGREASSFLSVDDLIINTSGNLLVLDRKSAQIKTFSEKGKYLSALQLDRNKEYTRLAVSTTDEYYLYESNAREIQVFSELSLSAKYTFAKFDINKALHLNYGEDKLVVNDVDASFVYSAWGEFLNELPANYMLDEYDNKFSFNEYAVFYTNNQGINFLCTSPIKQAYRQSGLIYVYTAKEIKILKVLYD